VYLVVKQSVAKMRVADGITIARFTMPVTPQRLLVSPVGDWLYVFQRDNGVQAALVDLR
jgi:hypothetical protein